MEDPKIFISYSHDSEEHKEWVLKLAEAVMDKGIDCILDQWDLELGSNLSKFMEKGMQGSDRVLVVCTAEYNSKANDRVGGVGYENTIVTSEIMLNMDTNKFIPVIRNVDDKIKTPRCLSERMYIDFTNEEGFLSNVDSLVSEIYGIKKKTKPILGNNPFEKNNNLPESTARVFFNNRFETTFPGVRGIEWFETKEAIDRLKLLFEDPIVFDDCDPFWWWRDGDLDIKKFTVISDDTVLIDDQEMRIGRIAAINTGSYYQSFVYIELLPSESTGVYGEYDCDVNIKESGYRREEYGIFKDHYITSSEYNDGAAIIDGKPVKLNGEAEVRVRYLSKYNLIIAPKDSPINNNDFILTRKTILNNILSGSDTLEKLVEAVKELPKNPR